MMVKVLRALMIGWTPIRRVLTQAAERRRIAKRVTGGISSVRKRSWATEDSLTRFILTLAISAGLMPAGVIITNYPQTNSSISRNIDDGFTVGAGFTMGSQAYDLTSVTLRIFFGGTTVGNFNAAPVGDVAGNPGGATLVNFPVPLGFSSGNANYTLLTTTPFTLQANTTYWLLVNADVPGFSLAMAWNASSPATHTAAWPQAPEHVRICLTRQLAKFPTASLIRSTAPQSLSPQRSPRSVLAWQVSSPYASAVIRANYRYSDRNKERPPGISRCVQAGYPTWTGPSDSRRSSSIETTCHGSSEDDSRPRSAAICERRPLSTHTDHEFMWQAHPRQPEMEPQIGAE